MATDDSDLAATLQIISPSAGVDNLSFSALPATTTIQQLKEKIRQALTTSPPDDCQRLIYRGRLLAQPNETLESVFGRDTLRTGNRQTLHLVLRDLTQSALSGPPTRQSHNLLAADPRIPCPGANAAPLTRSLHQSLPNVTRHRDQIHTGPALSSGPSANTLSPHPQPIAGADALGAPSPVTPTIQRLAGDARSSQFFAQPAISRPVVAASEPTSGMSSSAFVGHGGIHVAPCDPEPVAQSSTENTNTIRPDVGPELERWLVSVNEATVMRPNGSATQASHTYSPLSPIEVQQMLRAADAAHSGQAMNSVLSQRASFPAPARIINVDVPAQQPPPFPSSDRFTTPNMLLNHSEVGTHPGTRAAVPNLDSGRTTGLSNHNHASSAVHPQIRMAQQPPVLRLQSNVYILSSPTGPRALLVHNASQLSYYFTPPLRLGVPGQIFPPVLSSGPLPRPNHAPQLWNPHPLGLNDHPRARTQTGRGNTDRMPAQAALRPDQTRQADGRVAGPPHVGAMHPNNPGAGAVAAALWPHIWLIIRLVAVVWWFTSTDTSWSRWIMVFSLAVAIFLANTGMLDGLADQAWAPVRRHLDGLIPLNGGDPVRSRGPARRPRPVARPAHADRMRAAELNRAVHVAAARQLGAEPDPAQTAARLIARHQSAQASWVASLLHRVERASLLFLVSIAPGVAERHIARIEELERAERQRSEADRGNAAVAAAGAATLSEGRDNQHEVSQERRPAMDGNSPTVDRTSNLTAQAPHAQQDVVTSSPGEHSDVFRQEQ